VAVDVGSGSSQKTIGIVVGAVGVVGLVAGGVFAAQAKSKNDAALAICVDTPDACPDADVATHDKNVSDAKSAQTMSIVGFAVGGAALVGGAVLYFTAPSTKTALRVQPLVGTRGGYVTLGGSF
jgi:hypothetical protein